MVWSSKSFMLIYDKNNLVYLPINEKNPKCSQSSLPTRSAHRNMVFITIYTYYLYSLEHTLPLNICLFITTISLWNATKSFSEPTQSKIPHLHYSYLAKSFYQHETKNIFKSNFKYQLCNLSIIRLHDKSRITTKTSLIDIVNKPQAIWLQVTFSLKL